MNETNPKYVRMYYYEDKKVAKFLNKEYGKKQEKSAKLRELTEAHMNSVKGWKKIMKGANYH